ncbi:hypothetical protein [Tunicatimonas pelagia]|uniref:hypothetical protein n=1 Tax=Tunicatimonas pelagia TaxID=931531 RepID=UPI00266705F5|nr:hypothetical protein [Tunicatimonas pelagia]WKN44233.1 hypothetical protein P0M28_04540 [Tunicatimonas pelagia]
MHLTHLRIIGLGTLFAMTVLITSSHAQSTFSIEQPDSVPPTITNIINQYDSLRGQAVSTTDSLRARVASPLPDSLPFSLDSIRTRAEKARHRLTSLSDSVHQRLPLYARTAQPLSRRNWAGASSQANLDRYQQRLASLSGDHTPLANARRTKLQQRLRYWQRKAGQISPPSSLPSPDQTRSALSSAIPEALPQTETLAPYATVLIDTAFAPPSGQQVDQTIDQYARERSELQPLVQAKPPVDPRQELQASLQGYQKHLSGVPRTQEAVLEAIQQRLQSLGEDYQHQFHERLSKARRKLARSGSVVPDTSLSFGRRLRFSANLQLHPGSWQPSAVGTGTSPILPDDLTLQVDASPEVQYLVRPRWLLGLGGTYRSGLRFSGFPYRLFHSPSVYGLRLSGEWQALRGFSLRAEGERLRSSTAPTVTDQGKAFRWTNALYLGLVKYHRLSERWQAFLQALYQPGHNPTSSPHPRPYVIRLGVQFAPQSASAH